MAAHFLLIFLSFLTAATNRKERPERRAPKTVFLMILSLLFVFGARILLPGRHGDHISIAF